MLLVSLLTGLIVEVSEGCGSDIAAFGGDHLVVDLHQESAMCSPGAAASVDVSYAWINSCNAAASMSRIAVESDA